MRGKTLFSIKITDLILLLYFSFCTQIFAQTANQPDNKDDNLPRWGYAHIGFALNMFEINPGNMNDLIDPFEVSTPINFDNYLFLTAGVRNIAQIEYRWGKDSNNLFHDEVDFPPTQINRTTVDMNFDYSQVLFKVNPIFFVKGLEAWTFFFLWGSGSVDYIDKNGDGFKKGTKKTIGMEIGKVMKYLSLSASYEQNRMDFKSFDIQGYEPLNTSLNASAWQINVRVSVGFGI